MNFARKSDPKQAMGCCCAIVNSTCDRMLFGLRADGQGWCLPGGKVEMYETPDEAVYRETFEEVGIKVRNLEFVGSFELNGITDYIFFTDEFDGTPKAKLDEFLELRWIAVEELEIYSLFDFTEETLNIIANWTRSKK